MSPRGRRRRLDLTSLVGVPVGIGLVLLGQALEGGTIRSVLQVTAAVIVFGGTLGAVLISFSGRDVIGAARSLERAFVEDPASDEATIEAVVGYAKVARKDGILALEDRVAHEPDALLKQGISLAVDGVQTKTLREMLEVEIAVAEERELVSARVWEAAGGYAPTVGILGAVLGLIHVMENLSDPGRLGAGIAVAFVATVYGVGAANLVFLPLGTKLRSRAHAATRRREIVLEGVLAIQEGLNPRLIEQKLNGFVGRAPAARPGLRGKAA